MMLSFNKKGIDLLFNARITENRFYDKEIWPGRHRFYQGWNGKNADMPACVHAKLVRE
jgi:hypothetical protein